MIAAPFCLSLFSCDYLAEVFEPPKTEEEFNGLPAISQFTATYSTLLIQGAGRDSTKLTIVASDPDGSSDSFEYKILSGGGSMSGKDSTTGKTYSSGSVSAKYA